eukprot:PLAT13584.1.p1 GENE.PLAT13584.1~~PLAT13584.1.p1  ORF type:complete len:201 (-),score=83.37 PLAT13584.1:177-758(-)
MAPKRRSSRRKAAKKSEEEVKEEAVPVDTGVKKVKSRKKAAAKEDASVEAAAAGAAASATAALKEAPKKKPRGLAKSGRWWKTTQKEACSRMKYRGTPSLRKSWEKHTEERERRKAIKALQESVLGAREERRQAKIEKIRAKRRRRIENQMKSTVYQVISDHSKLRRMNKKTLRAVRKMKVDSSGQLTLAKLG